MCKNAIDDVCMNAHYPLRQIPTERRMPHAIPAAIPVLVSCDPDPGYVTSLGAFLADNEFAADEAAEIVGTLAAGRAYDDGGGAAAVWRVERHRAAQWPVEVAARVCPVFTHLTGAA